MSQEADTSASYVYQPHRDDFDQVTVHYLRLNKTPHTLLAPTIAIGGMFVVPDNGRPVLAFDVEVTGRDWVFVEAGESLAFIVDGERIGLEGDGSSRMRETTRSGIQERARYVTSPEVFRTVAEGDSVRYRVVGSRGAVEGRLSESNKENMRRFLIDAGVGI